MPRPVHRRNRSAPRSGTPPAGAGPDFGLDGTLSPRPGLPPGAARFTAPVRCLVPLLVGGLLLALFAACGSVGGPSPVAAVREWAQGPVRWLMLPAEERELRRLQSAAEGKRFIEEFWRRRDPTPQVPGNPTRDVFEQRVRAADLAYADEDVRGSLTVRGRALVLLGPPPLLRHGHHVAPAWRHGRRGGGAMPVRKLVIESWEYGRGDVVPALAALLEEQGEGGVTLSFLLEEDGARLMEGEDFLELAAQATVQLVPGRAAASRSL